MVVLKETFLLVDDDLNLLNSFCQKFTKTLNLLTAESAWQALEIVKNQEIAVVISDYNLPDLNGLDLIKEIKKISPDTVNILLTGEANLQMALKAINQGNIFRLLLKPCSNNNLGSALLDSIRQYRLIQTENNYTKKTLLNTIKMMTEVISLLNPNIFQRTKKLLEYVKIVSKHLNIKNEYEIELAALFAQIGFAAIPQSTADKLINETPLTETELKLLAKIPETGASLIKHIPRLEHIEKIVKYNAKNFNGDGFPDDDVKGKDIPYESRIIRILDKIIRLEQKYDDFHAIFLHMKNQPAKFDLDLLEPIFNAITSTKTEYEILNVPILELRQDDYLLSDVTTTDGKLLFSSGNLVTKLVLIRLHNYSELVEINEPIKIQRKVLN